MTLQTLATHKGGRPRGSSSYSKTDPILLNKVADRMVADESPSVRQAIVRTLIQERGEADPSWIRRLQTKFQPKEQWIAAARERKEAARRRQEQARPRYVGGGAAVPISELLRSAESASQQIEKLAGMGAAAQQAAVFLGDVTRSVSAARQFNEDVTRARAIAEMYGFGVGGGAADGTMGGISKAISAVFAGTIVGTASPAADYLQRVNAGLAIGLSATEIARRMHPHLF